MMKIQILCLCFFVFFILNSCGEKKTEKEYYDIASECYKKGENGEAIKVYDNLLKYYPTESNYFKIAYEQYNQGENEQAIKLFIQLTENYPDGEYVDKSIFMIGFIYANSLKNFEEAKKYYELFIEKYPEHNLVSSAKFELENLGKDINELSILPKDVKIQK